MAAARENEIRSTTIAYWYRTCLLVLLRRKISWPWRCSLLRTSEMLDEVSWQRWKRCSTGVKKDNAKIVYVDVRWMQRRCEEKAPETVASRKILAAARWIRDDVASEDVSLTLLERRRERMKKTIYVRRRACTHKTWFDKRVEFSGMRRRACTHTGEVTEGRDPRRCSSRIFRRLRVRRKGKRFLACAAVPARTQE